MTGRQGDFEYLVDDYDFDYVLEHYDGTQMVPVRIKDYGDGALVGFTKSGMRHMAEHEITKDDFVKLYKLHGGESTPRSTGYADVMFSGKAPRGSFCKCSDPVQYILCGSILDDSGEWIDLESLYNINGHRGEVVVFHFDRDEGGKLLKEMYYTQRLKLSGRSLDMDDLTVTFDDGTTLTLDEYDEYIGRQLKWVESLPPITPEDGPLYEWWVHRHDRHSEKPQGPNGGQDMNDDDNGYPKAATVNKDEFLFV